MSHAPQITSPCHLRSSINMIDCNPITAVIWLCRLETPLLLPSSHPFLPSVWWILSGVGCFAKKQKAEILLQRRTGLGREILCWPLCSWHVQATTGKVSFHYDIHGEKVYYLRSVHHHLYYATILLFHHIFIISSCCHSSAYTVIFVMQKLFFLFHLCITLKFEKNDIRPERDNCNLCVIFLLFESRWVFKS